MSDTGLLIHEDTSPSPGGSPLHSPASTRPSTAVGPRSPSGRSGRPQTAMPTRSLVERAQEDKMNSPYMTPTQREQQRRKELAKGGCLVCAMV